MKTSEIIRNLPLGEADAVLLGVPYQKTVSGEKGTAKAPMAICQQLKEQVEEFDFLLKRRICGEVKITEGHMDILTNVEPWEMVEHIFQETSFILNHKKFPVVLGGEHTVSLGAIRAAALKFPDLTVVQFDAHADMRENTGDYEEASQKIAHSTVMFQASMAVRQILQIGIRSMSEGEYAFLNDTGMIKNVIPANSLGNPEDIVDRIQSRNVYLTVDVDVLSGADFPGTGTFEPGGISWDKFIDIAKLLFQRKNVVSFDVVEVIPDRKTEYSAAKLVYNLIGRKFCK